MYHRGAQSMRFRFRVFAAIAGLVMACTSLLHLHAGDAKWESLLGSIETQPTAPAGKWSKSNDGLHVDATAGARLSLPFEPKGEYDFRVTFTRRSGVHSIALIFPQGSGRAAFEVDAWGEHLAGIQNVAGKSIRDNPTRKTGMELENGRQYTMTVEVRKNEVRGLLDGQVVATYKGDGSDLALSDLWALPDMGKLAIGAWESSTTFHRIEVRPVSGTAVAAAPVTKAQPEPRTKAQPKTAVEKKPAPAVASKTAPSAPPTTPRRNAGAKRVLIVIANEHFFYREYGDPRAELERAGIGVTVAAGRRGQCRSHPNSGEGADGGVVQADVALADVNAADFDALLFSGGWGASSYQYAFNGRYNYPSYNGDRNVKAAANRVINDFVKQDKYVCALCNGVSVLAWARVNGKSPLNGKRVCAPPREAPPGVYNGRPGQPSCRWHPENNGAILSPAGSVGRPGTAEDDVMVDGKIVTGEDDISAREMGRRIVQLLSV